MSLMLALISDRRLTEVFSRQIAPLSVECAYAFEPADFWEMLSKRPYDLIVAETAVIGTKPASLVARAKRTRPDATIVLLGGVGEGEAEGRGVLSLGLPLAEGAMARAIANQLRVPEADPFEQLVGSSSHMKNLRERVHLFAGTDSTVVLLGESGVGKDLIARAIHACSPRREGPFVAVNCGAIPREIIESELFGHVKGSFTGADRDRVGHFELADGGTLFLDEIGTMRLDHQVRLLRVLEDRKVTPIGALKSVDVDVRVITATNADLTQLMESGRFREDLFYRLNVLLISLPPLRERREDIPILVRHFIRKYARGRGLREKVISQAAMDRLMAHPWRGNVRELENAIEHAMVLSQGRDEIEPMDLPGVVGEQRSGVDRGVLRLTPEGLDLNAAVSRIERDMILQSLALTNGNKSKAAELLHLKRTTFVEKMRRLMLLDDDKPTTA